MWNYYPFFMFGNCKVFIRDTGQKYYLQQGGIVLKYICPWVEVGRSGMPVKPGIPVK
jgi:hypothetical protein